MKPSIALQILYHSVSFYISLPAVFTIFFYTLIEIILIDKIISRVIRRIGCLTTFDTITRLFP